MTEEMQDGPGPLYSKINGPYKRFTEGPFRNQLIEGEWTSPELELTAPIADWNFTEKLDGTNIRVHWDGYAVTFGGRTNKAQIPQPLADYLHATFREELFEQQFADRPVTVYGEGIGPGIQKGGGLYGPVRMVVFDVRVDDMWLRRFSVEEVAAGLGVETAPLIIGHGTVHDAISLVRSGFNSLIAEQHGNEKGAEGLVGTLDTGLLDRRGKRIITKIKAVDFPK